MDRLLATDLDGTLLRSDRSLSAYTVRVLNAAIDAGVGLTFATARSYHTAGPLLAAVRFRLPAIVYNGALVIRPDDGTRLVSNLLDPAIAHEVVARGVERGLPPFVFGFAQGREVALHTAPVNDGQRKWLEQRTQMGDPRLRRVADLDLPPEVIVVQFIAPLPPLRDLAAWAQTTFGDRAAVSLIHDVYLPGYYLLEVHQPRANKRDMLRWVAGEVGVPLPAVTAVGDNHNDLPMFEIAGRRLAVANAHPDVRAAADQVVASNDEDGVARYLAGSGWFALPR